MVFLVKRHKVYTLGRSRYVIFLYMHHLISLKLIQIILRFSSTNFVKKSFFEKRTKIKFFLQRQDLQADLGGSDFSKSDLTGASLEGANLEDVNFENVPRQETPSSLALPNHLVKNHVFFGGRVPKQEIQYKSVK